MASNDSYVTRAGLVPSDQSLPYSITTTDVENYLQDKLNTVVAELRQKGEFKGEDPSLEVVSVEMGSKFIPFTVVLPMSILRDRVVNKQPNTLEILNQKSNDATANIIPAIGKMLSSYTYNKKDCDAFYSPDWRRARGVSHSAASTLKKNVRPTVTRFNNGNMSKVTIIIDPVRIFYDMMFIKNNPADFTVDIYDWQKIRTGEFRYDVYRVRNKKKNKNKGGNNFADELNRKMKGFSK